MGLGGFDLSVAWGGLCDQAGEKLFGNGGRLLDGFVENGLIGFRWFMKAGKLADELQSCRLDLLICCRRIKVE